MTKVVYSIRFEPEEIALISQYAKSTGKSFSAVVCEATVEAIEDKIDTEALREAIADSAGFYFTLDEVEKTVL
jgi:uncharacterized protein (DUF1778 family)